MCKPNTPINQTQSNPTEPIKRPSIFSMTSINFIQTRLRLLGSLIIFLRRRPEQLLLLSKQFLLRKPTLFHLTLLLLAGLHSTSGQHFHPSNQSNLLPTALTYLQLLLMIFRNGKNIRDVIGKTEFLQRLLNMFTGNSFLRLFLAYLVRFGGYQRYEFHAAFHEQIARVFGEGLS